MLMISIMLVHGMLEDDWRPATPTAASYVRGLFAALDFYQWQIGMQA
jgi:hypothetical protein